MGDRLGHLVDRILDSYYADERTRHIDRAYLPSRDLGSIALKDLLLALRTAGEEHYLGPQSVPAPAEIEAILARVDLALEEQVRELTLRDLLTPTAPDATLG